MDVDVSLSRLNRSAPSPAPLINDSPQHSDEKPDELLNRWEVNVEDERANEGITDSDEPLRVEVAVTSLEDLAEQETLLGEICINKHEKQTSVEKLRDEDGHGDLLHLLSQCAAPSRLEDFHDDNSQRVVYADDRERRYHICKLRV